MTNLWLSGFLLEKSKLNTSERNNILATLNVDKEDTVLKDLEKKIQDLVWNDAQTSKDSVESLLGHDRRHS